MSTVLGKRVLPTAQTASTLDGEIKPPKKPRLSPNGFTNNHTLLDSTNNNNKINPEKSAMDIDIKPNSTNNTNNEPIKRDSPAESQYQAIFGKDAKVEISLQLEHLTKKRKNEPILYPCDFQSAIIWCFTNDGASNGATNPQWVFVKHRPLLHKIVVIQIDHLNEEIIETLNQKYHASNPTVTENENHDSKEKINKKKQKKNKKKNFNNSNYNNNCEQMESVGFPFFKENMECPMTIRIPVFDDDTQTAVVFKRLTVVDTKRIKGLNMKDHKSSKNSNDNDNKNENNNENGNQNDNENNKNHNNHNDNSDNNNHKITENGKNNHNQQNTVNGNNENNIKKQKLFDNQRHDIDSNHAFSMSANYLTKSTLSHLFFTNKDQSPSPLPNTDTNTNTNTVQKSSMISHNNNNCSSNSGGSIVQKFKKQIPLNGGTIQINGKHQNNGESKNENVKTFLNGNNNCATQQGQQTG